MKGTNELILNQATIQEAVQYWLTNKVLNKSEPSPDVTAVRFRRNGSCDEFIIEMEIKKPASIAA